MSYSGVRFFIAALTLAKLAGCAPLQNEQAIRQAHSASAKVHDDASSRVALRPVKVLSLKELRQSGVVVQQWDTSCAAAALATVLQFQHGIATDEKSIAESMLRRTDPLRVRVRGGFSLLDLKRHVETIGLKGLGYAQLTTDDLEAMAPLIVPVNFSGFPHFVVFRGVVSGQALLADPAFGNRVVDIDAFRRHWLGSIGFIVAGPDGTLSPPGRLAVRDNEVPAVPLLATRDAIRLR